VEDLLFDGSSESYVELPSKSAFLGSRLAITATARDVCLTTLACVDSRWNGLRLRLGNGRSWATLACIDSRWR